MERTTELYGAHLDFGIEPESLYTESVGHTLGQVKSPNAYLNWKEKPER